MIETAATTASFGGTSRNAPVTVAADIARVHWVRSMTPPATPSWRDKPSPLHVADEPLFDQTFVAAWGDEPWQPNDADRKAATELHVQLISRITTQRLGYSEGNEVAALR